MPKRRVDLIQDFANKHMSLDNLVGNLNSHQRSFEFILQHARGLGRQLAKSKRRGIDDLIGELAPRRSHPKAIPVLVTSAAFAQFDFGIHAGGAGMILSFAHLGPKHAVEKRNGYICLYLADLLASTHTNKLVHESPVGGCASEAHRTLEQLNSGLAKMRFCKGCRAAIGKAIAEGKMSDRRWKSIEQILELGAGGRRCFVLMPFAKRFDPIMNKAFAKFGVAAGWIVERADRRIEHPDAVENILSGIKNADLIIGDLTGANPNVFYEVGFAHASGKDVVLVTQDVSKTPFDLRTKRMHPYSNSPKGLKALRRLLLTRSRDRV